MSTVLAALDGTEAARPVMETAVAIGRLTGSVVEVVHVRQDATEPVGGPESVAGCNGAPFTLLEGPTESALLTAARGPDVMAMVLGTGATPDGRRPIGETAHGVLEHATIPMAVVPPNAAAPGLIQRMLAPLDGSEVSSRSVVELMRLLVTDIELTVLHVFAAASVPAMLDRPHYDLDSLGREFLARHCPVATGIEFRTGSIGPQIVALSKVNHAQLIVLSWSQDLRPGRAHVVREVLSGADVPVLLLPLSGTDGSALKPPD